MTAPAAIKAAAAHDDALDAVNLANHCTIDALGWLREAVGADRALTDAEVAAVHSAADGLRAAVDRWQRVKSPVPSGTMLVADVPVDGSVDVRWCVASGWSEWWHVTSCEDEWAGMRWLMLDGGADSMRLDVNAAVQVRPHVEAAA